MPESLTRRKNAANRYQVAGFKSESALKKLPERFWVALRLPWRPTLGVAKRDQPGSLVASRWPDIPRRGAPLGCVRTHY
jgi:hypothetical protein